MTYIMVNTSKLRSFEGTANNLSRDMADIRNNLYSIGKSLDWDIRAEAGIERSIGTISRSIDSQTALFKKMSNFFSYAHREYSELDKEYNSNLKKIKNYSKITPGKFSILNDISDFFSFKGVNSNENSKIYELVNNFKDAYSHAWKFYDQTLPSLASLKSGFKLVKKDDKYIIHGKRTASNVLEEKYLNWRTEDLEIKLHTTNGTNSIVATPWKWAKKEILADFKLKNQVKGGGILGSIISVGNNIYEYSWGAKSQDSIVSSEFLSSTVVDVGKGVIQGAVATGAGILASAAAGAAFGSIVPGLGTAVGFAVGIGFIVLDNTAWGQKATKWSKDKVNKAFKWTGDQVNKMGEGLDKIGESISGWSKNLYSW